MCVCLDLYLFLQVCRQNRKCPTITACHQGRGIDGLHATGTGTRLACQHVADYDPASLLRLATRVSIACSLVGCNASVWRTKLASLLSLQDTNAPSTVADICRDLENE